MDYYVSSICGRRNDFQKADRQGENAFATPRDAGFPLDPLSENSQMIATKPWFSDRFAYPHPSLRSIFRSSLRGGRGRFSCKKEPPGLSAGQKK
jgi:hypothetical protein